MFGRSSSYNIGYIIAQEPKKRKSTNPDVLARRLETELYCFADDKQTRPYLTVKPLAESLEQYGVPFNYTIDRDDVDKVAKAVHKFIKDNGKGNVLICWEHKTLEKVASAIGVQNVPDYPGER